MAGDVHDTQGAVVSVEGVTKRFGSVTAVDDLLFSLAPGTITGFLGPNGPGASRRARPRTGSSARPMRIRSIRLRPRPS